MASTTTRTGTKRKSSATASSSDAAAAESQGGDEAVRHQTRHNQHGNSNSTGDQMWDCTVCTYKNPVEAFKCKICDTRKGTSTRKPRLNSQVVEMQEMIQSAILRGSGGGAGGSGAGSAVDADAESDQSGSRSRTSGGGGGRGGWRRSGGCVGAASRLPRLKNVDRSTARHIPVTANGVTVIITDFKPKAVRSAATDPAAAADANDDSSTSIASPPLSTSAAASSAPQLLPSLATEEPAAEVAAAAASRMDGSAFLGDDSGSRRSASPPQISPQKLD